MPTGSTTPDAVRMTSTGLRPTRSVNSPVSGVTPMTISAATVASHSDAPSPIAPAVVRNTGT